MGPGKSLTLFQYRTYIPSVHYCDFPGLTKDIQIADIYTWLFLNGVRNYTEIIGLPSRDWHFLNWFKGGPVCFEIRGEQ